MSPNMANVSLITPVKYKGEYFFVSQIKGKALGSGEIHVAPIAGNVDAKYIFQDYKDPLTLTLKNECSEEIGLDLSYLNSTSFVCGLDDGAAGINFVSVSQNVKLDSILESYSALSKQKLIKNEELELKALSLLKISGLTLIPLENNRKEILNAICFYPSENGLIQKIENKTVRPYAEAISEYISKPENVTFLLEKAGF